MCIPLKFPSVCPFHIHIVCMLLLPLFGIWSLNMTQTLCGVTLLFHRLCLTSKVFKCTKFIQWRSIWFVTQSLAQVAFSKCKHLFNWFVMEPITGRRSLILYVQSAICVLKKNPSCKLQPNCYDLQYFISVKVCEFIYIKWYTNLIYQLYDTCSASIKGESKSTLSYDGTSGSEITPCN